MIRAAATFNGENSAGCAVKITGNAELIAVEYASITHGLMEMKGGQAILNRAMDIIEKEINEHEEKRS